MGNRKRLVQQLQILLRQQNMVEHKEAFYSAYGVTSSTLMDEEQLRDAIRRLGGKPTRSVSAVSAEIRHKRSEVLKLLTAPLPQGLGIPNDWSVLNPFVERHAGKLLTAMTASELSKFRRQLFGIRSTGWSWRTQEPPAQLSQRVTVPAHDGMVN